MLLLELMCSAVIIVAELMCSAVMFVAGIDVFYCDDCAEIDAPDCVLRSEILFRCRNWTSCSELIFAVDLCVAQWNSVSLPQLNLLQRIHIRCRFVCCAAKFCFADATEPPAAIWYSLPICVLRSEILFRYRSWTSCSEVIFATEVCVVQRNCGANSGAVLAVELAACGEPVLAAELGSPQRTNSRCRFLQ